MILIAGGVQLLRLSDQQPVAAPVALGAEAAVGDVRITVRSAQREGPATVVADVRLGGIDDNDGLADFGLVHPGGRSPVASERSTCVGIRAAPTDCVLAFEVPAGSTGPFQLVVRRADDQVRWVLDI